MESIHLKTVDPVAQTLLRRADQQGLELSWDRFEDQQPQDGFHRAGLSCAFGCMQGPCRIDPFGRGAQRGMCGADRDVMVAASLLRLCLNGALEAGCTDGGMFGAAAMLSRPSESAATMVAEAVRLGALVAGAVRDGDMKGPVSAGYGVLAGDGPTIGITGTVSEETAKLLGAGARAVSLGAWVSDGEGLLPIACSTGEVEAALVSKRIHVLFAGRGTAFGLTSLAEKLNIPVATNPAAAIKAAKRGLGATSGADIDIAANMVGAAEVYFGANAVAAAVKETPGSLALLGGYDTPHQSLGWIPTETAPALMAEGLTVASWGDAAVWMAKAGLAGDAHPSPAILVGSEAGARDVVAAAGAARIKGACFSAPRDARDVALAIGLAAQGVRVLVATPLPVWGSSVVIEMLDGALAGSLRHVDKPIGAEDVLAWFQE